MHLEYTVDAQIGWITLSNPPYNTLTHPVFADVEDLRGFLETPSLKAAIVRGQGRHFCGGAEIDALKDHLRDPGRLGEWLAQGKALLEAISFATIPVLALVTGSCLGAGLEIALACHFRFAAQSAMFGFPEAEHGVMPGFGGTILAQGAARRQTVIELILSGRMIRAEEALSLGLIDRVVPAKELEAAGADFLRSLTARRQATLIRAVMASIHNGRRLSLEDALRRETELFCKVARGDA